MSRFWGRGDSSSESESEQDSDSLEEVQNQRTVGSKFQGAFESDSGSLSKFEIVFTSQIDRFGG